MCYICSNEIFSTTNTCFSPIQRSDNVMSWTASIFMKGDAETGLLDRFSYSYLIFHIKTLVKGTKYIFVNLLNS